MQGNLPLASAADTTFELPGDRVGMMTVATHGQRHPELGGPWYVDYVQGFVAPRAQAGQVAMALGNLIGTFSVNPKWFRAELGHQVGMMENWRRYQAWSSDLQRRTIEERHASSTARTNQMNDMLGGTVRLRDPVTGETFQAIATDRYYYRLVDANRPTVAGSSIDQSPLPQLDMRRMLTIGVETPDR